MAMIVLINLLIATQPVNKTFIQFQFAPAFSHTDCKSEVLFEQQMKSFCKIL